VARGIGDEVVANKVVAGVGVAEAVEDKVVTGVGVAGIRDVSCLYDGHGACHDHDDVGVDGHGAWVGVDGHGAIGACHDG
jgi:hypothetical protein